MCNFILIKGKNKGKNCSKNSKHSDYCSLHYNKNVSLIYQHVSNCCKHILLKGKNKGKNCNKKVSNYNEFCSSHSKTENFNIKIVDNKLSNKYKIQKNRCNGITKKNEQCKKELLNGNFCNLHLYQEIDIERKIIHKYTCEKKVIDEKKVQYKDKIKTEDLGKMFEYAICKAFNVEYKGKFKYDVSECTKLCKDLNLCKLKDMFPDFEHTAIKNYRYDFTSKDGKKFLSSKTSKNNNSKIAPQCIGQIQPSKFCKIFNIEFIDNITLQKYIENNIVKVLDKFIEYTFDCPIIYYNRKMKSVKIITLNNKIVWSNFKLVWTRPLENGSATLKICNNNYSTGILEIQFHTKNRTNMTSRWILDKMLKIFPNNFNIEILI